MYKDSLHKSVLCALASIYLYIEKMSLLFIPHRYYEISCYNQLVCINMAQEILPL